MDNTTDITEKSMLSIQKFLKTRPVADLRTDPFNLHIQSKSFDEGELFLFKYNQFKSNFSHDLVCESRGIILEKDTWKVVCHPFKKWFNYGEPHAFNHINLDESIIAEKVDSSLIKLFYYNNEWQIATNGTIDARDAKPGFITVQDKQISSKLNFRDLFFDVIPENDFNILSESLDTDKTYLFEMVHPLNQIVVDYFDTKELVFLGMKENNDEMRDFNIFHKSIKKKYEKTFKKYPIRFPKTYTFQDDISELRDYADSINVNSNQFEGFVVNQVLDDIVVGRVKIKSPKYLYLHHFATGESVSNKMIESILENEVDEIEAYLDKYSTDIKDEYESLKKKYNDLVQYLNEKRAYYTNKSLELSRKELALNIQSEVPRNKQGMIFTLIDKDIDIKDLLKSFSTKKIRQIL